MALELVTGYAGKGHITSDDVAGLILGICGPGLYLLGGNGEMSVYMTSSNSVTIGAGDAVIGGRHVHNNGPAVVTLANGPQNRRPRHDLICIEYDLDTSTQVESAQFVTVMGSDGLDSDPKTKGNQYPLVRVSFTGLNANAERIPSVGMSLSDLETAIKAVEDKANASDSGLIYGSGADQIPRIMWERRGNVVTVSWYLDQKSNLYWRCPTKLPVGVRPPSTRFAAGVAVDDQQYGTNNTAFGWFDTDGSCGFQALGNGNSYNVGSTSWAV